MRIRLVISIISIAFVAIASDLRLAWNPSTTPGVSYILYASTNSLGATNLAAEATARIDCGTNTQVELAGIMPSQWKFAVTARTQPGIESDPSNILIVEIAKPPPDLRVLEVQFSSDLTNWSNAGYFRLKLN